jgi:hypothetical protein
MSPLQAEMLSQTIALLGSVIAVEMLPDDHEINTATYQESIAKELRKAARAQLTSLKLVSADPRPRQRPAAPQPPKA